MAELARHADHDPGIICRPAFGYGLCEPLTETGTMARAFTAVVNPRVAEVLRRLGWQEGRDYVITPDLDVDE